MNFIESVYERLRRHPKRIVFPEGEDPDIIAAARQFADLKLGIPVLLGGREAIEAGAARLNVSLRHIRVIDPAKSQDFEVFCERLERLERYRKMGLRGAAEILLNPNYFGAMMLQYGLVDGMVGGVHSHVGSIFRPLMKLVKPLPDTSTISSCMVVELPGKKFGDEGVLFLADCAVVPDPDVKQLAQIALQTGLLARQVFGRRPRVALLSFSTKGSIRTPTTEKVAMAASLARELSGPDGEIAFDGEMQADVALVPELAALKTGPSLVAGKANVLIFPDLNSGNIAAKLIEHLMGATVYGQMIVGLTRPAADVGRGAKPEKIVAVAALVALQSVEYRTLYPEETAD